jgi:hypothetical protein
MMEFNTWKYPGTAEYRTRTVSSRQVNVPQQAYPDLQPGDLPAETGVGTSFRVNTGHRTPKPVNNIGEAEKFLCA